MAQARKDEEYRANENKRRRENPSTNVGAKTRMAQKRLDDLITPEPATR